MRPSIIFKTGSIQNYMDNNQENRHTGFRVDLSTIGHLHVDYLEHESVKYMLPASDKGT